jgi:hypothetical protein
MDDAVAKLLEASPYLLVLAWVILRQDARIDKLLESQKWLLEQFMALHPPQDDDKPEPP